MDPIPDPLVCSIAISLHRNSQKGVTSLSSRVCPTSCLSMTEEYELSTYDRHELNYNQIALSRLPISIMGDYTIQTIRNSSESKINKEKSSNSRTITDY